MMETLPRRLMLLTANVGSLFDESHKHYDTWIDNVVDTIESQRPAFVAIHMQEVGGKNYHRCMQQVPDFVRRLCARLDDFGYTTGLSYMDLDFERSEEFTALGSIYLCHCSFVDEVEQYDFSANKFIRLISGDFQLHTHNLTQQSNLRITKFPSDFWPSVKAGRKGYLFTRWRLVGTIADLVNVHLFHDESNLALIDKVLLNLFIADNRKLGLDYVLERLTTNAGIGHESTPATAMFIFGDLNFRLDSQSFLLRIAPETELRPVESAEEVSISPSNESKLTIDDRKLSARDSLRRTLSAIEFRRPDCSLSHCESDCGIILRIEKKRFDYINHKELLSDWRRYLIDDKELHNFPTLRELPINFQPTYPWSEDPNESESMMNTRPPAWCDRVLMNESAMQLTDDESSEVPAHYDSIGRKMCMGDHKPVFLCLSLPKDTTKTSNNNDSGVDSTTNTICT